MAKIRKAVFGVPTLSGISHSITSATSTHAIFGVRSREYLPFNMPQTSRKNMCSVLLYYSSGRLGRLAGKAVGSSTASSFRDGMAPSRQIPKPVGVVTFSVSSAEVARYFPACKPPTESEISGLHRNHATDKIDARWRLFQTPRCLVFCHPTIRLSSFAASSFVPGSLPLELGFLHRAVRGGSAFKYLNWPAKLKMHAARINTPMYLPADDPADLPLVVRFDEKIFLSGGYVRPCAGQSCRHGSQCSDNHRNLNWRVCLEATTKEWNDKPKPKPNAKCLGETWFWSPCASREFPANGDSCSTFHFESCAGLREKHRYNGTNIDFV
ncbi:hypothetical protein C8R45DRAFT_1138136 [Mycena sanguinolenta]|nr:hypothetical protein C8R45DRAFT_1138136 [Mycena sanguinolenta]